MNLGSSTDGLVVEPMDIWTNNLKDLGRGPCLSNFFSCFFLEKQSKFIDDRASNQVN